MRRLPHLTILLATIGLLSGQLLSCEKEAPPRVTDTQVPAQPEDTTWHPSIVFEAHVESSSSYPRDRPVIHGDYVVLYHAEEYNAERKWSGIVRYDIISGARDTILEDVYGIGLGSDVGPDGLIAYQSWTPDPIGLNVVDIPAGELYAFVPTLGNGVSDASADGRFVLDLRENADKSEVEILRFYPSTGRMESLFRTPRAKPNNLNWSAGLWPLYWQVENTDTLLFGVFSYHDDSSNNNKSHCFAYNLGEQKLMWVNEYPHESRAASAQTIAVDDRHVYQKGPNRIVAFDRLTGEERWRSDIDQAQINKSDILIGDGYIYFLGDGAGGTMRLDAETGTNLTVVSPITGTMTTARRIGNLYAFISTGNPGGHQIFLFDPMQGQYVAQWVSPNCGPGRGANCGFFADGINVDQERGYIVAHDWNWVYVFDVSDYLD